MPLVLVETVWEEWMNPDTPEYRLAEMLSAALRKFESYPISTRVNYEADDFGTYDLQDVAQQIVDVHTD